MVTLAMLIPKHVLGPDPNGMKLYGFCISFNTKRKEKKRKEDIYVTPNHSCLSSLYLMDVSSQRKTVDQEGKASYFEPRRIEFHWVLIECWIVVYASGVDVDVPSSLDLVALH